MHTTFTQWGSISYWKDNKAVDQLDEWDEAKIKVMPSFGVEDLTASNQYGLERIWQALDKAFAQGEQHKAAEVRKALLIKEGH